MAEQQTSPSRVLVTGGAGFVGTWLVSLLLERTGAQVAVLDNLFNGRRDHILPTPRVSLFNADLRSSDDVRRVLGEVEPEWIFHLGAIHFIPYCNRHPLEAMQINVVGTQTLLEACKEHPPRVFVAASSAAVYPIQDGPCGENGPLGPTDIYGLTKQINEEQVKLYAATSPTRCVMARLFNVYGPHETNPHVIPEIVQQLLNGARSIELGNVEPKRDYVHASDVARALLLMAERADKPFGVYNVGTGEEYSVRTLVDILADAAGTPVTITVAADRVRKAERMHLLCDTGRIRADLDWAPQYTLDAGLRDLWAWAAAGSRTPAGTAPEREPAGR